MFLFVPQAFLKITCPLLCFPFCALTLSSSAGENSKCKNFQAVDQRSLDPVICLNPLGLEVRKPSCPNEKPKARPGPPPGCPVSVGKLTLPYGLYLGILPQVSPPSLPCSLTHIQTPLSLALTLCTSLFATPLPSCLLYNRSLFLSPRSKGVFSGFPLPMVEGQVP